MEGNAFRHCLPVQIYLQVFLFMLFVNNKRYYYYYSCTSLFMPNMLLSAISNSYEILEYLVKFYAWSFECYVFIFNEINCPHLLQPFSCIRGAYDIFK